MRPQWQSLFCQSHHNISLAFVMVARLGDICKYTRVLCICTGIYISVGTHVHTHTYQHIFLAFVANWGTPRLQSKFLLLLLKCMTLRVMVLLWDCSCPWDHLPLCGSWSPPCWGWWTWQISLPLLFSSINIANSKPDPVLEKLCSSSSSSLVSSLPTLYHPFQPILLTFSLQAPLLTLHGLYSFFSK